MLTIEQIRERLADRNLHQVAERAGIHRHTLYRIANGTTSSTYETIKKLSDYLEQTCRI